MVETDPPAKPDFARTVPPLHGLRTFVLNLRRREDRRNYVESVCRALGLNYEIVEALDGIALQAREGAKAEHLQGCEFRMSWPCDSSQDPPWAIGVTQSTTEGALTWDGNIASTRVRIHPERAPEERWGVVACLLGHVEILDRIKREGHQCALVLEDDCRPTQVESMEMTKRRCHGWEAEAPDSLVWAEICKRYEEGAHWISSQAPMSWHLLFLGGVLGFSSKASGGEEALRQEIPGSAYPRLLVRANRTYQAHAYLIHENAIASVRERLCAGFAADAALAATIARWKGDGCWRFSPSLLRQRPGQGALRDSDITGGRSSKPSRKRKLGDAVSSDVQDGVAALSCSSASMRSTSSSASSFDMPSGQMPSGFQSGTCSDSSSSAKPC